MIDHGKPDDEMKCHRDGHKHRLCKDLRDTCWLWIRLPRQNRTTGDPVEEYHCGDVWNVILAAEHCREMTGLHAALNSFRNETVKRSDNILQMAAEMALLNQTLPPPDPDKMEVITDGQNNNSS